MEGFGWNVEVMGCLFGVGRGCLGDCLAEIDFFGGHMLSVLLVGIGSSVFQGVDGGG